MKTALDGYLAINLPDIPTDKVLNFDLYLYLSRGNRMLLYRKKGQSLDNQKMQKFKKFNVQNLFIKNEDKKEYFEFTANRLKGLAVSEDVPEIKRIEALKEEYLSFLNDMFSDDKPVDVDKCKSIARELVRNVVNQIDKSSADARYAFLESLITEKSSLSNHLMNVSTFSVLFAFGLGHFGQEQTMLLCTSGLFHGVGLKFIDPSLCESYLQNEALGQTEWIKLTRHINKGVKMLRSRSKLLPPGTLKIISQQLENHDGSGFPKKLKGDEIHEFARIMRIAMDFNILASKKRTKISPAEVMRKMMFNQKYSPEKFYDEIMLDKIMTYLGITRTDIIGADGNPAEEGEGGEKSTEVAEASGGPETEVREEKKA